jgi:hypothetical protein
MKPSDGGGFILLFYFNNDMIGIYGIFRKSDNKCMYVGQSKNIEVRILRHLRYKCTHLKIEHTELYYGKSIEIFDYYDKNILLNSEAKWIDILHPCLNSVIGRHRSIESKRKISDSNRGKGQKKGKKCICKDGTIKMIDPKNVSTYLSNGWHLGRK